MIPVSVVTVSFNSARTIERTLQSVAAQSHSNVEHIVVDGGSTDGTIELLRRHERTGLRWLSEPDGGMYDAMNKGIGLATGWCVGIVNSDDWLEPFAISDVVRALDEDNADFTFGDVYLASEAGDRIGLMTAMDLERLGDDVRYTMPFPHQSCYVRREVFGRIGTYSLEYRLSADHDFIVRMLASRARGVKLPRPIASYRAGGLGGGQRTFKESRDIAVRHGMSWSRANRKYAASLIKVWLARRLPRSTTRFLMRLKGSRHVWY